MLTGLKPGANESGRRSHGIFGLVWSLRAGTEGGVYAASAWQKPLRLGGFPNRQEISGIMHGYSVVPALLVAAVVVRGEFTADSSPRSRRAFARLLNDVKRVEARGIHFLFRAIRPDHGDFVRAVVLVS